MEYRRFKVIGSAEKINKILSEKNISKSDLIVIFENIDVEKTVIKISCPDWRYQDVAEKTVNSMMLNDLDYSEENLNYLFDVLRRALIRK